MNSQNRLISLTDVSLTRDQRPILTDISMDVNESDFIAITGPNGGGKTTLLRVMLRLLKPDRGSVTYSSDFMTGYLPQKNMIDSHFPISVNEVVASGLLAVKGLSKTETKLRVQEILSMVDMTEHADKAIGVLSGGQLQRALLGRAIISRPELLVLDEPLSYIDKRFESQFYTLIANLKETTTVVLVSHEMTRIAEMATRHLIVDQTLHECSAHHHYVRSECE